MTDDDNELYELDRKTADRYVFVTTPADGIAVHCLAHDNVGPDNTHPARAVWGVLAWIEQHEHAAHGAARPVPYVPVDATTVLPVVSAGGVPAAVTNTGRHGATVAGSVPPGRDWTALAAVGLELRHISARAVGIARTDYADGSRVFTLPADGFPGATWEIRVEPKAYALPAPSPATSRARVCTRCGGPVDGHAVELPVGIGSRSATHPATLCRGCFDGFAEVTVAWVLGAPELLANALTCGHPIPDRWISTGCVVCRSYVKLSGMEPPAVQRDNGMEVRG